MTDDTRIVALRLLDSQHDAIATVAEERGLDWDAAARFVLDTGLRALRGVHVGEYCPRCEHPLGGRAKRLR